MGHGEEYRYAHDEPGAYAAGENYFPESLKDRRYYHPVDRGLEQRIAEKLESLRQLDKKSTIRRYEK
jgi:putative ATPase